MANISKSRYTAGIQCPKRLWLQVNRPELAEVEAIDEAKQAEGNAIGDLAMGWFGPFTEVELTPDDFGKMVERTRELIEGGCENICEATFSVDGLFCSVDILHRLGNGAWEVAEVKSSTKVKDYHVADLAFQCAVLRKAGFEVEKAGILHVDSSYVRGKELDLHGFMTLEDLSDEVLDEAKLRAVADEALRMGMEAGSAEEPAVKPGPCCDAPHACPFKGYCMRDMPSPNVFDLGGITKKKAWGLVDQGVVTFDDVAGNPAVLGKLNARQQLQVKAKCGLMEPVRVDRKKVREFLGSVEYPLYLLDFETFQPAIPLFEGSKPYQQIPSQYSLHILESACGPENRSKERVEHREFLGKEGTDPRRELAEALVRDIPMGACSMAYNMSFEKSVIKALAESFPDLAKHLMDIHDGMVDLMVPFQKGWVYLGAMGGSYSIKYVLPACYPDDPELDYHGLEGIHNGAEAMAAFKDLANHSPEEIAAIRENLLRYCELDTFAMAKVLWWLEDAVA